MNQEAKTKLVKARIAMIMRQPFFGTLALRLLMVEDATLNPKTLATDGKTFYYHPDWVLKNDHDIVMSGVAHETAHCVFDHIGRRNGRDPKRWNHACDYQLNLVLKDCGFVVPPDWLCNSNYAGMSADEIYKMLPPDPPGSPFDSVRDMPADDKSVDDAAADWADAAIQAGNALKGQGSVPDSLKRFIDEMARVPDDWRAVMSRFVTERSREDYSFQHLNRKFAAMGIFLPGLYSESMGEVCACIDTSGSINQEILNAFGAHLSEIKDQMKPMLTRLIYCDARVNHTAEFEQYDELKFECVGGGGTDFRPPFAWIDEHNAEPKCFMYLTDGYGPFPSTPPPYPVLWLMTTDVVPPWGEVVRIEV